EDGIRDLIVTGVQTCALPISVLDRDIARREVDQTSGDEEGRHLPRTALLQENRGVGDARQAADAGADQGAGGTAVLFRRRVPIEIGRASCRERGVIAVGGGWG